ncbi:MAG: tRNA lysidine(34) synthetase TilS [Chlorobiaceae bacterium]|nr:tRNA lysidine(34) synthetase TilS [Chlorobiaceae bacterium]
MNPFEKRFLENLRRQELVTSGDAVLLAISGGPDSMALLHLFIAVMPVLGCRLAIAHCNFGLRGEASEGDEQFVLNAARESGLTCHVRQFDTLAEAKTSKRSIEETARSLRYSFFGELCHEYGYTLVATGHHAGDNAETLLFNLFRGTGMTGLRGIRSVNGNIIRPLLSFSRVDVLDYLEGRSLGWRVDHTNHETVHDRNFIRHRVIPAIEERFGAKLSPALQRLSEQVGEFDEFVQCHIARLLREHPMLDITGGRLHVVTLQRLTTFERKELLKRALMAQGVSVDGRVLKRLDDLLERQPGRSVPVGRGITVIKKEGFLVFGRGDEG